MKERFGIKGVYVLLIRCSKGPSGSTPTPQAAPLRLARGAKSLGLGANRGGVVRRRFGSNISPNLPVTSQLTSSGLAPVPEILKWIS